MQDIRLENFKQLTDEIYDFNIVLYALLYKANVTWSDDCPTAAVNVHNGRATFYFNPTFWDKLTVQEQLFLILHECYHVFLFHFQRFREYDDITNAALDVAVNHSLLRQFNFTDEQLPYLRINGCWCDTVVEGQILLDTLSAEEYLLILKQNATSVNYISMDAHGNISPEDLEDLKEQLKKDLKDLLPDKTKEEIEDLLSSFEDQATKAGSGSGDLEIVDAITKNKQTWTRFAKKLQKDMFKTREESVWLPNKRLRHLEKDGMHIPTMRDEDILEKVNVVLFLDTSGSCSTYKRHFLGFAKALPQEFFNIHCYGFNTTPYKVDLKAPKFRDGGTSFHFFQRIFDEVPGKKIAFVFTDGYGSHCELTTPSIWNWFMFSRNSSSSYIPKGCRIHKLEDFE